eukprot:681302-Rhodomonas_salina.1
MSVVESDKKECRDKGMLAVEVERTGRFERRLEHACVGLEHVDWDVGLQHGCVRLQHAHLQSSEHM